MLSWSVEWFWECVKWSDSEPHCAVYYLIFDCNSRVFPREPIQKRGCWWGSSFEAMILFSNILIIIATRSRPDVAHQHCLCVAVVRRTSCQRRRICRSDTGDTWTYRLQNEYIVCKIWHVNAWTLVIVHEWILSLTLQYSCISDIDERKGKKIRREHWSHDYSSPLAISQFRFIWRHGYFRPESVVRLKNEEHALQIGLILEICVVL